MTKIKLRPRKIQRSAHSLYVTIPKDFVYVNGLKFGDVLNIEISDQNELILTKVPI